jgi:hypothetical protein
MGNNGVREKIPDFYYYNTVKNFGKKKAKM